MKGYFFYCLVLITIFNNCNKESKSSNLKSIVVTDNGDKFYLSEGNGMVYKNDGLKVYKFTIPRESIDHIENIYNQNELNKLPNDYIILSTNQDSIKPKQRITTITFYFNNSKKQITFQNDGYNNSLDRFPKKEIKPIFQESFSVIKKIRDSTKEYSELPR